MILVRDIYKSFGDHEVLRGVSFDVRDKETLVMLGKSGSGKSVLLRMIIGLLKPDSGTISTDGSDIAAMSYEQLREERRKFGFLFQDAALFDSLTVGENIALPLRQRKNITEPAIKERVAYALELVDLAGIEKKMPSTLSGGMKKRVGLARAIAPNPLYMLYDEPTTGLDVGTADEINSLMADMRTRLGITSIVVTHDIRSAFIVGDRFMILERGRILMTGTRDDLENSTDAEIKKYINSSLSS
ncbi:MAG: ATP-binding cassette domain-containing protein [bacterium]